MVRIVVIATPRAPVGCSGSRSKGHANAAGYRSAPGARPGADGQITAESRDLSDGGAFDWQAYVTSRPDHAQVIGAGIWKFECRFLAARDPNAKILPAPQRFDFIAHRVDGSAVRMHPESRKHGKATEGHLDDWALVPGDGALPAGPASSIARNDTIGAFAAQVWLQEHVSEPNQDVLEEVSAASREAKKPEPDVVFYSTT